MLEEAEITLQLGRGTGFGLRAVAVDLLLSWAVVLESTHNNRKGSVSRIPAEQTMVWADPLRCSSVLLQSLL